MEEQLIWKIIGFVLGLLPIIGIAYFMIFVYQVNFGPNEGTAWEKLVRFFKNLPL